jgi:serine/threonine-protein kinase
MTGTLGLRIGERNSMDWSLHLRGRPVHVQEDSSLRVAGHWEAGADWTGKGYKVALPNDTRLFGRLYVHKGRVYGRFTEARTPLGVVYPVCLELLDTEGHVGLELRPGSGPGKMMVDPVVEVRVVDRFK